MISCSCSEELTAGKQHSTFDSTILQKSNCDYAQSESQVITGGRGESLRKRICNSEEAKKSSQTGSGISSGKAGFGFFSRELVYNQQTWTRSNCYFTAPIGAISTGKMYLRNVFVFLWVSGFCIHTLTSADGTDSTPGAETEEPSRTTPFPRTEAPSISIKKWPRFIIKELSKNRRNLTIHMFDAETEKDSETIGLGRMSYRNLAANAYSKTFCMHHTETFGIVCYQNGSEFVPEIPRSNRYEFKSNMISLSPFGDHIIFEEINYGGIWILSLKTQKARCLLDKKGNRYKFLEVDWDNGYLLILPREHQVGIEVYEIEGGSGTKEVGYFPLYSDEVVRGLTLDPKTTTAYWITNKFIARSSYKYDIVRQQNQTEEIVGRADFGKKPIIMDTFRFYGNSLFWSYSNQFGLKQVITGLAVGSLQTESKRFTLTEEGARIYHMVVYEDMDDAWNRTNPCLKCSHICVPRRGVGYECTCPFRQPLLSADGVKIECQAPLTVWVVAQRTSETSGANWYLQTYDAMANFNISLKSSNVINTSTMVPQPDGYCTSTGPVLECFNITGSSLGQWSVERSEAIRVLAITQEAELIWFNGTCVKHQSQLNVNWTLHCDPEIDPNNVVLDHVNWHLFYRSTKSRELIHYDFAEEFKSVLANVTWFDDNTQVRPMRLALDGENQQLLYQSLKFLRVAQYNVDLSQDKRGRHFIKMDMDERRFSEQKVKFIGGFLYWLEIQNEPQQNVIVRFDMELKTRETFVRVQVGYNVTSFDVESPVPVIRDSGCTNDGKCSHFCRKETCWCPQELPDLENHVNCTKAKKTPNPSSNPDTSSTTRNSIIGFILTVIVFAVLNGIGFHFYKKFNDSTLLRMEESFKSGDPELVESAANDVERAQHSPFNDILDPKDLKVHKGRRLGMGNFGIVCEGEYQGHKVAIKSLKDNIDFSNLGDFFKELKIMAYIGKHMNIVQLIGADTSQLRFGKLYAVLEFSTHGSLDVYLKQFRDLTPVGGTPRPESEQDKVETVQHNPGYGVETSEVQISETSFITNPVNPNQALISVAQPEISDQLLCHWSYQIGRAMAYLTSKGIVHGDLAARNVLVFDDNTLKVTDFGQSHNLYQTSIYVPRNKNRPLPWRWLSPEAFEELQFSSKSDVWSYGVTMWEIFEFAKLPYPGRLNGDVNFIKELKAGSLRLPKPDRMPQIVCDAVFRRCFETKPEDRIDFDAIERFWVQYFTPQQGPANQIDDTL